MRRFIMASFAIATTAVLLATNTQAAQAVNSLVNSL